MSPTTQCKKNRRVSKHTASLKAEVGAGWGGVEWWQGQFPSEQDPYGHEFGFCPLEGTIRNISFLPKS